MKDKLQITAFECVENPMSIQTADRRRDWMDATVDRFAYRCLPVAIANQVGWDLLNPVGFTAKWNGKDSLDAISIKFDQGSSDLVGSHFGSGVLTFSPGYLFRTTKSHNLWCKGPTNSFKDGIAPLEGIIETDWAPFSFTMNWKFTRKRHKVRFEEGEPICRIIPYPRHYASKYDPQVKNLNENPKLYQQFVDWRESRIAFNEELKKEGSAAAREKWQRSYMKGEDQKGTVFAGHQTKVQMKDFRKS